MIDVIENLPEVSFIDDISLNNIKSNLMTLYMDKYKEITGKSYKLNKADPVTLVLHACAVQIYQALLYTDRAGKLDLLKYSYDEFLDNLAAFKGVERLPATAASVTMRFTLSEPQTSVVSIPEGTRVAIWSLYFETSEYAEVPIGESYVDVVCTCQETGTVGNDIAAGMIKILVDPVPYVDSVINIDDSSGGTDIEDDEDLVERVYYAPSKYSTAGPKDAYEYHVRTANSAVGNVKVTNPSPGVADIYVLMEDGSMPSQIVLDGIAEYLEGDGIRPMTDLVHVKAPGEVSFNIDFTYYINRSDMNQATTIQSQVEESVNEYIGWQTGNIGIDINPSKLIDLVMDAGAKRVEVREPAFTVVGETNVARLGSNTTVYGGIEDD